MTVIPINANENNSSHAYMNGDPISYMEVLSHACLAIQERLKVRGKIVDTDTQNLIRAADDALIAIDEHLNSDEDEHDDS